MAVDPMTGLPYGMTPQQAAAAAAGANTTLQTDTSNSAGAPGAAFNTATPANSTTPTTPTPPMTTAGGMAPLTGFAGQYTPAMANQAYENPWYVLPDVFPGMSTSSPIYQALRDFGADPLTLFNIIAGSQNKIDQGASPYINWLNDMYSSMGTKGGQGFDANQLIQMLFGQTKFGAESGNTLGQILGAGDMGTQVRTLFNMLRDVSNAGMNPLAARGYQAAVAQAGDKYGNAMMKTDATEAGSAALNPSAWIAENLPWLAGR
jgi:hypothetical protein